MLQALVDTSDQPRLRTIEVPLEDLSAREANIDRESLHNRDVLKFRCYELRHRFILYNQVSKPAGHDFTDVEDVQYYLYNKLEEQKWQASRISVYTRILQRLHSSHQQTSHFYFARNLNCYLRKKYTNCQSVLFNDFLFYDCDDEFLKRTYKAYEIPERIKLLAAYFKRNRVMPSQTPFILSGEPRKLLDKRSKRRLKTSKKVKQLDQADPFQGTGEFIFSLDSSQLEASSRDLQNSPQVSYQSTLFDIYGQSSNEASLNSLGGAQSVTLTSLMALPIQPEDGDQLRFSEEEVSHLICDFQDKDVDRILKEYHELNVEPPKNKEGASKFNLKLNLDKLTKSRLSDQVNQKVGYEEFYEAVKRKQEERKPSKVYYVRGAQKNHQLTSRSPQNRQQHQTRNRIHTQGYQDPYDTTYLQPRVSPKFLKPEDLLPLYRETDRFVLGKLTDRKETDRIPSYRNTDRQYFHQEMLTDRTCQRENHYRRILDRLRENRNLGRVSSLVAKTEREDRRMDFLKEKAVELLASTKQRVYESPKNYRNYYIRK